jgi:hypothetical protein
MNVRDFGNATQDMPRLIVHPRTPLAWEIQLKAGENYLGRAFANDFKIEDPSVSGAHCQILVQAGQVTVKDLGSTNGTFVNRAPVQEATLTPGQTLHLGGVELLFAPDELAAVPRPGSAPPPVPPVAQPPVPPPMTELRLSPRPGPARLAPPVPAAETEPARPAHALPAAGPARPHGATAVHVGVQSCKFHPAAAARWLCPACQKYYCDACVGSKRVGPTQQRLCRACGGECVPVIASVRAPKVKTLKQYSDAAILARSIGFAFAGAVLSSIIWVGIVWLTSFDVSFIFALMAGALCGYGVKLGSQDRPGLLFSAIAVFFCLLSIVISKFAAVVITGMFFAGITKLATDVLGVVVGCWLAHWLSGGDG